MGKKQRKCGGRPCARWGRRMNILEPMILLLVAQEPAHGYGMVERLADVFGITEIHPQTIYRALQDMETAEWITANWDMESVQGPPKKVYQITEAGTGALAAWSIELEGLRQMLDTFVETYNQFHSQEQNGNMDGTNPTPSRSKNTHQTNTDTERNIMKIAISASGPQIESPVDLSFGRCPYYLLVDTDNNTFEAQPNSAAAGQSGVGIKVAQNLIQSGAKAILASKIGPNAYNVINAAGVPVYNAAGMTAAQAVEAFKNGTLQSIDSANNNDAAPGTIGAGNQHRHGQR